MLRTIPPNRRVQWDTFTILDPWLVDFVINLGVLSSSETLISVLLSYERYRMYGVDGYIGYGYGDTQSIHGITENESYSKWIEQVKKKERDLKSQLPVIGLSQTQFDTLMSIYYTTGTWRRINGPDGLLDLEFAVTTGRWSLLADMISTATIDHSKRLSESRILMLGDYGQPRSRSWLRNEGIQFTRTNYVAGLSTDLSSRQAENAYYRETGAFLPGVTDLRKREIIQVYKN